MTRALLPGFWIAVGPGERLVILEGLGMSGALRFRTRAHAESWIEKHEAESRDRRAFGPEGHHQ